MNDRELLELAAMAAGVVGVYHEMGDGFRCETPGGGHHWWSPLEDDGDALRLAMDLELGVVCKKDSDRYERNTSVVTNPYCVNQLRITQKHCGAPEAATRRAIVRAAAEIGRTK